MKAYFPRTPRIMMRFFSKFTWRFHSNEKQIFLTFDDGPTPEITEFVLRELKKYNAKATFFCIGKNIQNHPDIFNQIIIQGHSVGNHTQNHLNGWKTEKEAYLENVSICETNLQGYKNLVDLNKNTYKVYKTLQEKQNLFRPPYGKIKKKQANALLEKGYHIIMWDVLSADFDTSISKEKCLQNVLKNTKEGSIIVFHDSIKAAARMQYVLPIILKEFSKKGYTFSRIS